jgi:DNA-binding XRE family transcriptional regulator
VFRNLDAEQARFSYTNQQMADKLGISRVSYENKKKTGKFTALEAKKMCIIFKVKFDYLFATDDEMPKAHLSVKKIADGYAECDVRLTAGHKK